jgi:outer membrane lipoprotein SlyB
MVWVSPWHVVLALTTGLLCGVLSSRVGGGISPPYAAILGAAILYPVLVAVWQRLPRPGT